MTVDPIGWRGPDLHGACRARGLNRDDVRFPRCHLVALVLLLGVYTFGSARGSAARGRVVWFAPWRLGGSLPSSLASTAYSRRATIGWPRFHPRDSAAIAGAVVSSSSPARLTRAAAVSLLQHDCGTSRL